MPSADTVGEGIKPISIEDYGPSPWRQSRMMKGVYGGIVKWVNFKPGVKE